MSSFAPDLPDLLRLPAFSFTPVVFIWWMVLMVFMVFMVFVKFFPNPKFPIRYPS